MIHLHQIDPIAIQFPAFELFGRTFQPAIHWYGIMYLLAFATAWWLGRRRIAAGRLPGVDANGFGDLLFYGMLGVVLGGRIGYVLFYALPEFLREPLMIVRVWDGGMSFHGGLLGVLVGAWIWARRQRLHFFDVMDFVAPLVPPGLGFGRIGNYIGAELWGKYTQAGWGVVFPTDPQLAGRSAEQLQAEFAAGALDAFARHPSQLYQAFLEGLVMFIVLWWYSSRPRPRYALSGLFALLYGVFRFAVEFVRVPDADIGYIAFGWLTMGQLLSLPLVALGAYLLWRSHRSPTLQPTAAGGAA
ncbi:MULTISPECIES: prolipoprotein diacylglyceryl transferase [Luteimonas]|jgi:phosphatidylglycerol:prolipoprotein diacylglycerol transferase|uniref:Phosphatidylglycerol--prolipoprotein diacylglyceryl transferase n=1 Tax=Luteimonas wenzhouensis TaxID=2599615 RepID=A0A5C5U7D0_9GAMM|nr:MULTISPECIES: prolipoprotein diacylglyceryl transferase [Luteimonas]TWG92971.1 phosphatidylglycerol:prolipoprotein diacylglycerol transferase [Luteimonas sp. J16]TWT21974.1 prolipoprotein diacylglyceryl transferase [Luteimonas wenzhouensis]